MDFNSLLISIKHYAEVTFLILGLVIPVYLLLKYLINSIKMVWTYYLNPSANLKRIQGTIVSTGATIGGGDSFTSTHVLFDEEKSGKELYAFLHLGPLMITCGAINPGTKGTWFLCEKWSLWDLIRRRKSAGLIAFHDGCNGHFSPTNALNLAYFPKPLDAKMAVFLVPVCLVFTLPIFRLLMPSASPGGDFIPPLTLALGLTGLWAWFSSLAGKNFLTSVRRQLAEENPAASPQDEGAGYLMRPLSIWLDIFKAPYWAKIFMFLVKPVYYPPLRLLKGKVAQVGDLLYDGDNILNVIFEKNDYFYKDVVLEEEGGDRRHFADELYAGPRLLNSGAIKTGAEGSWIIRPRLPFVGYEYGAEVAAFYDGRNLFYDPKDLLILSGLNQSKIFGSMVLLFILVTGLVVDHGLKTFGPDQLVMVLLYGTIGALVSVCLSAVILFICRWRLLLSVEKLVGQIHTG